MTLSVFLFSCNLNNVNLFFFFFQAEDGIRDATVTGVQTCALPISPVSRRATPKANGGRRWVPGDRKSTRLNSSHGSISYAVFCLKKKKISFCFFIYIKKINNKLENKIIFLTN